MEEKKLRQLFKNRADAYLNTIDESVEQGMSEDCFIKAVNEVFSLHVVVKSFTADEVADMLVNKFTTIEEAIHFFDMKSK